MRRIGGLGGVMTGTARGLLAATSPEEEAVVVEGWRVRCWRRRVEVLAMG